MTTSELTAHLDELWSQPMTLDERIEWDHALNGLDVDFVVATAATLQRSYPNERPTTARFLAAYRGVSRTAERPERTPRRTGKSWADEIREANPSIPTHLRSDP